LDARDVRDAAARTAAVAAAAAAATAASIAAVLEADSTAGVSTAMPAATAAGVEAAVKATADFNEQLALQRSRHGGGRARNIISREVEELCVFEAEQHAIEIPKEAPLKIKATSRKSRGDATAVRAEATRKALDAGADDISDVDDGVEWGKSTTDGRARVTRLVCVRRMCLHCYAVCKVPRFYCHCSGVLD
jgi:hypothetical protein